MIYVKTAIAYLLMLVMEHAHHRGGQVLAADAQH
jgi:hypothetical protein